MSSSVDLIATLVRGDEVLTDWFPDRHELVAFCDADGWKVLTVSKPETILADIRGRRLTSPLPEQRAVQGRPDLLAKGSPR